jgi:hypothetical protein
MISSATAKMLMLANGLADERRSYLARPELSEVTND